MCRILYSSHLVFDFPFCAVNPFTLSLSVHYSYTQRSGLKHAYPRVETDAFKTQRNKLTDSVVKRLTVKIQYKSNKSYLNLK